MPTRKQRRRREKNFRHEYDFVTYDEEGNEVEVDPQELRKEKEPAKPKQAQTKAKGGRPVREVPPPSWRRAVKRGGLMGIGLIVLTSFLMKGKGGGIIIGVFYAVALIPFTYWIDRFAYRNYLKRSGKQT